MSEPIRDRESEIEETALEESVTGESCTVREKEVNAAPALEERFAALDDILRRMDQDDVPLEEAFRLYKSGLEQVQQANQMLDAMEQQLLILNEEGDLEEF